MTMREKGIRAVRDELWRSQFIRQYGSEEWDALYLEDNQVPPVFHLMAEEAWGAALEALAEPSEVMVEAAVRDFAWSQPDPMADVRVGFRSRYRAMIQAAQEGK